MEKIENVNQIFRNKNHELTLTKETKNNTIEIFQRKKLVTKNQLKNCIFTPPAVLF